MLGDDPFVEIRSRLDLLLDQVRKTINSHVIRLALLRDVDRILAKPVFDSNEVFDVVMNGAIAVFGDVKGQLLTVDKKPGGGIVLKIVWTNGNEPINTEVDINNSITGIAIKTKEVFKSDDVSSEELYNRFLGDEIQSEMVAPVIDPDTSTVTAAINIESPQQARFQPDDVEFIQVLAGQVAVAISKSRIQDHFNAIAEIQSAIIDGKVGLNTVLQVISRQAGTLVGADFCQILLLKNDEIYVAYSTGLDKPGTRVSMTRSVSGRAARTRTTQLVPDIREDDEYQDVIGSMLSELAVPAIIDDRVVAVINVESSQLSRFSEYDIPLIQLLANQAASAILQAQKFQELTSIQRERLTWRSINRLGEVYANSMHRINNILGPVPVWIDRLMGSEESLGPDIVEILDDIRKASVEVLELPAQMKARLTVPDTPQEVDINAMLRHLVEALCPPTMRRNYELDEDLPKVFGFSFDLEEIIWNVITNAVNSMAKKGGEQIITVGSRTWLASLLEPESETPQSLVASKAQGSVLGAELWIRDTGRGIPESELASIFEMGRTDQPQGLGLGFGLWMVRSSVESWGGSVYAESKVGEWAMITIRIPAKARTLIHDQGSIS